MAMRMGTAGTRRARGTSCDARQSLVVADVQDIAPGARRFTLAPAAGGGLLPLRAGCSLPVFSEIAGREVEQALFISSSPRQAREGSYQLVIRHGALGHVPDRLWESWQPGCRVHAGSPRETAISRHLHDGDEVVALAGGTGIDPLHSAALALAEGDLDCKLTLFCLADSANRLPHQDEWPQLEERSNGRLKVLPATLSPGQAPGGGSPLSLQDMARHADLQAATFIICAPGSQATAIRRLVMPLGLSPKRLHFSFSGDAAYGRREDAPPATHQVTVRMAGETHVVPAQEDETILEALEKAGLGPAAYCRSGICGVCQATPMAGYFTVATDEAAERKMRDRYGTLHPCCSYPATDMEIVAPRPRSR